MVDPQSVKSEAPLLAIEHMLANLYDLIMPRPARSQKTLGRVWQNFKLTQRKKRLRVRTRLWATTSLRNWRMPTPS